MAIKDWITNYPTSLDTNTPGNMEDLVDGADLSRVSQIHSIRDALIAIETEIGTTVPAVGSLRKRVADLEGLVGTDEDAIHDNVADEIHQIALKGTPISSDVLIIEDSADLWNKKRITLTSLPGGGGVTPLWEWNKTDLTHFPPVPWFGSTVAPGSASLAVDSIAGYPWLRASATFLGPPVRVPDAMVVWPIAIPAPAEGNDYIIVADMFQPEDSIELEAGQRVTNFCLFSRFYPTAAPGLVGEWHGYVLRGYDVLSGPREARCDRLYRISDGITDVMRLGQWIDTAFYGDLNTDYGYGIRAQIGAQGLTNVHHSWSGHRLVPFEEENEGITESNPYYIGDPGIGLHGTSLPVGYPYTLTVYFTNIRVFNFNDIYPVL